MIINLGRRMVHRDVVVVKDTIFNALVPIGYGLAGSVNACGVMVLSKEALLLLLDEPAHLNVGSLILFIMQFFTYWGSAFFLGWAVLRIALFVIHRFLKVSQSSFSLFDVFSNPSLYKSLIERGRDLIKDLRLWIGLLAGYWAIRLEGEAILVHVRAKGRALMMP